MEGLVLFVVIPMTASLFSKSEQKRTLLGCACMNSVAPLTFVDYFWMAHMVADKPNGIPDADELPRK